jgi:NAD(P)-dependent dehydrogenase (short-subunit alcohol dehydrogenase family)
VSEFTGKRYVVTGAASGIGHAVAEQLLAAGAAVISLDRNTPTAAVPRHIEVDLANPRSIDAALEQLDGRFDGLINVAGIPGQRQPIWCSPSTASRCGT